ncbi:hypothetical protein HQ585_09045 [candidate division KSB1 bacterium]|nr:hypothetical protein [candidate division KSB1 bacterium]
MKKSILILMLISAFSLHADGNRITMGFSMKPRIQFHEDCRIYERHNDVYIVSDEDRSERVIITDKNELLVNGKTVETDSMQAIMTQQYYDLTVQCLEDAKNIGKAGAKMGWEGAKIGVKAVTGVFRMILPDYDADDLERDMEYESEKIEAKADILEEKADALDEKLEELEDLHYDLQTEIEELGDLLWF